MPDTGDLEADGYFIGFEAIRETPVYTTVKLTYSEDQSWTIIFQPSDGDSVFYCESRGVETPLELHPDFLMKWTYDLFRKKGDATAVQAWAGTAKTASDADNQRWKWAKTDQGAEWVKVQDRTKPGYEVFLKPSVVVRQENFHRLKVTAEGDLTTCGYLVTPSETFGYSTGTWLVSDVDLHNDGKYWVAVINHMLNADNNFAAGVGWDPDIYDTP
jgi:hypothetical protein